MFQRILNFSDTEGQSFFLWGARQTGKSTLLKELFPDALWFDLLLSDVYRRLVNNPAIVRETILANPHIKTVIIDEIQRIPELLNEIHWMIENTDVTFILSGSSPRKILRSGSNLLGGRALRYELLPLVSAEIPEFDLMRAINHGLLPRHYLSDHPNRLLSAYAGNYLRDEIVSEAKIRNVQVFARFLEAAAFSNGEIVNYSNIASDCGVSSPTIKEYFRILEDTLIGRFVPVFQKKPKRKVISSPKFYFFDVGVVNHLMRRPKIEMGTELFGNAFEQLIYQEIYAYSQYSGKEFPISYWRTTSQIEIDFVLGDHEIAIEVKSGNNLTARHTKGLLAFMEEYTVKQAIVVCNEPLPRLQNNLLFLPWREFLNRLWKGEII